MRRPFLSFFFFILLANPAWAERPGTWEQPDQRTLLTGTLGEKLHVIVDLSVFDTPATDDAKPELYGHYTYRHVGTPIQLTGQRERDADLNTIALTEKVDGKTTGRWNLRLVIPEQQPVDTAPHWVGTWTSADGRRVLPVHLELAAEYELGRRSLGGTTAEWALPIPMHNASAREVLAGAYQSHRDRLAEFVTNPDQQVADFRPDRLRHRIFWDESKGVVAYWDDQLISVLIESYIYSGGAHANGWYDSVLLHINDKGVAAKLELSDLVVEPGQPSLLRLEELVLKELARLGASYAKEEGNVLRFQWDDLSSFTVGPQGLTIYFAPYAVGSYAEGSFRVTLAWKQLGGIIDPQGPMRQWMQR